MLVVQKSSDHPLRLVVYPIIFRVLYIAGGINNGINPVHPVILGRFDLFSGALAVRLRESNTFPVNLGSLWVMTEVAIVISIE